MELSRNRSHQSTLDLAPPPFSIGAWTSLRPRLPLRKHIKGSENCHSPSRFSDRARRVRLSPDLPSRTGNTTGKAASALDTDREYYFRPGK